MNTRLEFISVVNKELIRSFDTQPPIPCIGDHFDISNEEWIVTGRLFGCCTTVKIFVRKATKNDVTYM